MSDNQVMRERFLKLIALVVVIGLLAACQPSVVKETVVVEKPVEKVVKETVVVEKPVEKVVKETVVVEKSVEKVITATPVPGEPLKFWTFYSEESEQGVWFQEYIDQWNATHAVKFEYGYVPWANYTGEGLTTAFATREGPDVFVISAGDWRRYAAGRLALPLNESFPAELKEDILPAALDAVTLDGKIYSLPFEMEPVALWYNKEMLEQAGIDVPETWDDLVTACEALTTEDRYGLLIPTVPDYYQNFVFYPFLWMAGGEVMNDDFTAAAINTPESARALDLWGELVQNGYANSTEGGPWDIRFPEEQAAMYASGYWVYGLITDIYPDFVEKVGVTTLPVVNAGDAPLSVYGGWTLMVYSGTDYPAEASEFAIGLYGGKDMERIAKWGTELMTKISTRKSVNEYNADFYKEWPYSYWLDEVFPTCRAEPSFPPEIAQAVYEALQDVMFGGVTGAEAAAAAEAKINAYLETQ
jgi:multiple sugar transport system substrate-binding protein